MSATVIFLAVTTATASPLTVKTPLYTVRMEQASNKMNFLPTEMNGFTYTAEKGYTMNYDILECYCAEPLIVTWQPTCEFYPTCDTCETCVTCGTCYPDTCPWTKWINCRNTQVYPTCDWPGC